MTDRYVGNFFRIENTIYLILAITVDGNHIEVYSVNDKYPDNWCHSDVHELKEDGYIIYD